MLKISINQTLRTITINGKPITIKVISDNDTTMELAYRLWYEVQVIELKYPLNEGINHLNKSLSISPNGSIVFMAMDAEECVGTIRTTCDQVAPLEFEYENYLGGARNTELTKLVVAKRYRKTNLLQYLFLSAYAFHETHFQQYPYENIVFNANRNMINYYKVIGHSLITEKVFINPLIKTEVFLMYCTRQHFGKICKELKLIVKGNSFIKAKWAIKYWWYRKALN